MAALVFFLALLIPVLRTILAICVEELSTFFGFGGMAAAAIAAVTVMSPFALLVPV